MSLAGGCATSRVIREQPIVNEQHVTVVEPGGTVTAPAGLYGADDEPVKKFFLCSDWYMLNIYGVRFDVDNVEPK
jgi:hypothetical protein